MTKFKCFLLSIIFISLCFISSGQSKFVYGSNKSVGKYARINNLKLYYEIYGSGNPLLMIHGGLGSISDFDKNISELSKHYEVIVVDSRGHGRSSNPIDSLSYKLMCDDMIDFLDYLKIDSVNIVGFSDGGVIGLYLAAKYPKRVIKMIASGANYLVEGMTSTDFPKVTMSPENVKKLDFWGELREQYVKNNPKPNNFDRHIQQTRKMWLTNPYIPKDDFVKISDPVILVFGDRDMISLDHALEMYRLLPSKTTQLCIFPNTGHSVFQQKADEINHLIINFLK